MSAQKQLSCSPSAEALAQKEQFLCLPEISCTQAIEICPACQASSVEARLVGARHQFFVHPASPLRGQGCRTLGLRGCGEQRHNDQYDRDRKGQGRRFTYGETGVQGRGMEILEGNALNLVNSCIPVNPPTRAQKKPIMDGLLARTI